MKNRLHFGEAGESLAHAVEETRESLARVAAQPGQTTVRRLGVPALFAVGSGALGSAVYFILGVVAGNALGLTPVAFLVAGAFFLLTMLTYAEGNALHPEHGGASTLARYAFNEFWSFVAGWAILLDYLIVMAMGAFAISHYLVPFWAGTGRPGIEVGIAALAIAFVVRANVRGIGPDRLGFLVRLGLVNVALLLAIVVVGLVLQFDAGRIAATVRLGSAPTWANLVFATVVATVAVMGIETASGLSADLRVSAAALRRVMALAAAVVVLLFVGVSLVALSAVPVRGTATALGGRFVGAPMLGVVGSWQPPALAQAFRYLVAVVAAVVLLQAVNSVMLGVSRVAYSLATNRQIPRALGRLHPERSTPYLVIAIAGALALGLVATTDLHFLAGLFAFGAMLAFFLAHLSVIVLRFREPARGRVFAVPLSIPVRGRRVPVPALLGAAASLAAWISVLVLHSGARIAGPLWMAGGIVLYVAYRRREGASLTERVTVAPSALQEVQEVEYGSILVPVFGDPLDDDIVGTAGRLAADEQSEEEGGAVIEALYVVEIPISLPLDARLPDDRLAAARRALARAKEVGEEYEGVEVATATARARSAGHAIVDEARRRGVEAIVLAAEEPTRIRGGGRLGGRGGPRDRAVGEMTRYVLEKAPCRVILTAAPSEEAGERDGVAP